MAAEKLDQNIQKEEPLKKVVKFFKIYVPLLSFIGIIAASFFAKFYSDATDKELSLRGVKTIGTVYDYTYCKGEYCFFYHFKVNGKDYSDGSGVRRGKVRSPNGIRIGAQYEVTYLPESPRRCRIDFSKRIPFKSRKEYLKVRKLLDSLDRVNFNNWKSAK